MMFEDDQQILTYISDPTRREFGYKQLIGKYKERLYWHIRRLVNDHEDTDDVLQNTFIKIVNNIDKFQNQSALYTWLYRIATNEALNFLQVRKKKATEDVGNLLNLESELDDFDENFALKELKIAIDNLPSKQKVVFNLRYYSELSYQEIADITDTSIGALKASYHHAVKKIEEHIKSVV